MNAVNDERLAEYLARLDAARLPAMTMPAHDAWATAYRRGLVSDDEWDWYCLLIDCHPCSWKGWLRWTIHRDMMAAQGVNHVQ